MSETAAPSTYVAHAHHGVRLQPGSRASAQGSGGNAAPASLDELIAARPSRVFETGPRLQLVPARLYRDDDRVSYLQGMYPTSATARTGALALPRLDAVGVFERHEGLPDEVYTGDHVAGLFLAAAAALARAHPDHALAFFAEDTLWLALTRRGQTIFLQAHRVISDVDAVFYVAAHLQHFGRMRESTTVVLGGRIAPGGSLHRQLSIYFPVCALAEALAGAPDAADADEAAALDLLRAYEWGLQTLTFAD